MRLPRCATDSQRDRVEAAGTAGTQDASQGSDVLRRVEIEAVQTIQQKSGFDVDLSTDPYYRRVQVSGRLVRRTSRPNRLHSRRALDSDWCIVEIVR